MLVYGRFSAMRIVISASANEKLNFAILRQSLTIFDQQLPGSNDKFCQGNAKIVAIKPHLQSLADSTPSF